MADALTTFAQAAAEPWLHLVGIHFHIGSQVTSIEPYRLALRGALELLEEAEAAYGVRVQHIDVGGGFAIPYTDEPLNGSHPWFHSELTPADYADVIFAELAGRRDDLQLFIEPGRSLVGNAAVLLSKIVSEKSKLRTDKDGVYTHWLFVDAGFNTLLGAVAYDWYYPSLVANRCVEPLSSEFRLTGPLCDGGDVHPGDAGSHCRLRSGRYNRGGRVAFLNTGAYTWDTRSHNNGRFPAGGFLLWDDCLVPM
jgi:diaminopimelate decarboxylase